MHLTSLSLSLAVCVAVTAGWERDPCPHLCAARFQPLRGQHGHHRAVRRTLSRGGNHERQRSLRRRQAPTRCRRNGGTDLPEVQSL